MFHAMADTEDYLTVYRRFFEAFAATVQHDDQLPVTVGGYYLCDSEIVGEIVDWTVQYLNLKHCPSSLVAPLTRIVVDEIKCACKKQPTECGYRSADSTYQPLKLMKMVTGKVNDVCLRYHDNGKLATLPQPSPGPPISSCAIKNTRRRMEDRHVVIEDFHTVFDIQDRSPTSYYAVFDGHAGTDAAIYSVSHLHQFLAESSFYPTDPERALKDAFSKTDMLFLEKSNRENLKSGTTAVCVLLRPKEQMLYVAWLGDSQALLVRNGQAVHVVNPHKPDRQDERERIEDMGGCVLFWGTWRVNGQLAVSRAIGDLGYKPYVTSEPDVTAVPLDGTEDFLVLACDGLWDFVTEEEAVMAVYEQISEAPGDIEAVSQRLVQLSKQQGSTDNISVIVVFLTEPAQLASRPIPQWADNSPPQQEARAMETNFDHNTNSTSAGSNPFLTNPTSDAVPYQKGGLLLDLGGGDSDQVYRHNGAAPSATDLFFLDRTTNGKKSAGIDNYEDDDFGPETDVDAIDDVLLSPTSAKTASLNNNPFDSDEQRALEADLEVQRQQLSVFDPVREPREETPTPPADEVPGVTTSVPESDNVGESGEDSEDEWNYFRVEPTAEGKQQAAQPICQKPAQPQPQPQLEGESNMESQLNPDAAEFVPSPTQVMASMEEVLLAQSPSKGVTMEDISVPSQLEFQLEVSHRPSEMDLAIESSLVPESKLNSKLPDLISSEDGSNVNPLISSCNLANEGVLDKTLEQGEKNEIFLEENISLQEPTLDDSEVTSTKAEYGDDSTSFLTVGSELQKTVTECVSSCSAVDNSFTDLDLLETEFTPSVAQSNNSSLYNDSDMSKFNDDNAYMNKSTVEENVLHEEGSVVLDSAVPVCFEVQKDLIPEMELKPERVQLESEGASSFEDSGSPLQADDKQLEELDESAIISEGADSPVPNVHSPIPEESSFMSHIQQPSLQDLLVTDIPATVEPPISHAESETVTTQPLQSPTNTHTSQCPVWGSTSPIPTLPPVQDSVRQEVQSILPQSCGETYLHEQIRASPELLGGDILEQPAVTEREEVGKCHEMEVNGLLVDLVGNVQSLDTSDPRDSLQQDVSTVIPNSLLEQSPLLRNDEHEMSPDYDSVLTDTAREKERKFPSGDIDINIPVINPVKAEVQESVEIPAQAPTNVSEDLLQLSSVESPSVPAEPTHLSEKVGDDVGEAVLVAAAAATVATAVAAGTVMGHEENAAEDAKAPAKNAAKKSAPSVDKKEPAAVKTKVTKTTVSNKTATATTGTGKVLQKSKPTSPTKPASTTTIRSSTPKKSSTSASSQPLPKPPSTTTVRSSAAKRPFPVALPPAGRTTKSPVTADKPKPGVTSPTKTTSPAIKSASVSSQPRSGTTNKSSTLSNGDIAKPAVTKKAAASTGAKPQNRPATAPATARTATMKQAGTVTSRTAPVSTTPPRPKPRAVNVGISKSVEAGTVPTEATRNKVGLINNTKLVTEKQVKQTANKQISAHTVTSKTTSTSATRRIAGVTKTTVTSSTGKVGLKKTSSSTTNSGTHASSTVSTKAAKTEVTVVISNNETVQVQQAD